MSLDSKTPPAAVARRLAEPLAGFEYALNQANRLLARLTRVDLRGYESVAASVSVPMMLRGPVAEILSIATDAMRLITTLPYLVTDIELGVGDEPELELDLEEEGASELNEPSEGDAHLVNLERFCEEIDDALERLTLVPRSLVDAEALSGLCQMLVAGLRQARQQIMGARQQRSKWGLIATSEEARRKVQRAMRAALCTAARIVDVSPEDLPFGRDQSELASALRVRDTLLTLREDMLVLTRFDTLELWALQKAATAAMLRLAALRQAEAYPELWATDRFQLERLRGLLEKWLASASSDLELGRHTLLDLHAYCDLLLGINHREILVEHDRVLARAALDELEACAAMVAVRHGGALAAYLEALARLEPLRWRDEALRQHLVAEQERGVEGELEHRVLTSLALLRGMRI